LSNLDAIGELRQKMATIDHQLSDVSNIIKGYLSYRTTDPPAEETAPQEFTSEEDIPEEVYEDAKIVSDIQNRIQEFKQNQLNYNMNQISNEQDTSQEQTESEQIS
jgi:Mg2+ and Co2+ transporter CorA